MGSLRIVSRDDRAFEDRAEAGRLLGEELRDLQGRDPLVLGIPRGGLIIAREVVGVVGGELDIALARKLRAPINPELAIGAMSERGDVFVDPRLQRYLGFNDRELQREQERVRQEIQERQILYRGAREQVPLQGRIVVITDDGLATGATMHAALLAARQEQPAELIGAVPVASEDSLRPLAELCDEFVCLRLPDYFAAVGQFYLHFDQTSDDEVVEILRAEQERVQAGVR